MILIWLHRLQGLMTEMIGGRTALGVDGCFLTPKLQPSLSAMFQS